MEKNRTGEYRTKRGDHSSTHWKENPWMAMATSSGHDPEGPRLSPLLVDPGLAVVLPFDLLFLGEPQADFTFSTLHRITAVTDVAASLDAVVTTNGTWKK